jgi:hypothetical protein
MDLKLLEPRALWLLAAALPVLAMYLLRSRRTRVKVPSTLLWEASRRQALARTPWQRLRPETSLLLELLVVAALALATARPVVRRAEARAHVALLLDESASMGATEDGTTRLERGRSLARALVRSLPEDTDVLVLGAGHEPRVLGGPTRDDRALTLALERAAVQELEGSLDEALALAGDRLRALGGAGRVVVVSDGAVARAGAVFPGFPVEVLRVGGALDNVAVTRVELRAARGADGQEVIQAFALLSNLGEAAAAVTLAAKLEGQGSALASRAVVLAAGARVPVTLSFPAAPSLTGRGVVLEKTPADMLPADDRAFATVPPGRALTVTVDAREDEPWLLRALSADPEVELRRGPAEGAPEDGMVFAIGRCVARTTARAVVLLGPPSGRCGPLGVLPAAEAPRITAFATTDPRLRFLTLDGVHLTRATPLELGPRDTALVRSDQGVLAADASDALRTVTVLGFTPAESDWPLRASFVVFVRNLVEQARAQRARRLAAGARTGETLRVDLPPGVTSLRAEGPVGPVSVSAVDGVALLRETTRAGFYTVRWPGGGALRSVSLLSEREADLRAPPWAPPPAPASLPPRRAPPPRELPGPWLALTAALAALGNLLWLTRGASQVRTTP